mgnify:FL=1
MQKVVDTIKIEKLEGGAFNVVQGDRYSDTLSYDEMLGLVSALTIAKEPMCLRWMQTKEEHDAWRDSLKKSAEGISEVEFEDILVPESIGICKLKGEYMRDFSNGDGLYIRFNDTQVLGFCDGKYRCDVISKDFFLSDWYEKVQCKLIPCNREDLKAGDTAFAVNPNFEDINYEDLSNYCKVMSKDDVCFIDSCKDVRIKAWDAVGINWYKVVLV